MELIKLDDILKGEQSVSLADGAILCATTHADGYTGTYQGNHYFQIKVTPGELEEEASYQVVPVVFDFEKQSTAIENPILITEGKELVYIVGTNLDAYKYPVTLREEFKDEADALKKILLAFTAFAQDNYRIGRQNIFLSERPTWVKP